MSVRNISAPTEMFARADAEAQKLGLSFSAFVRLLISNYCDGTTFEKRRDVPAEKEDTPSLPARIARG